MIDLHCHILPGIDDGASSDAESLSMARRAVEDGIHTVVATPHTLNDVSTNPPTEVSRHVSHLREMLLRENIPLILCPGSDMHICVKMAERIKKGEAGTINDGGRYVLVEFPVQTIPPDSHEELFQLKLNNITPIITHPERNTVFQHQTGILYDWVSKGCLVQITAMSITGEMGEDAMQCAHRLLELRLAHVIATDAHSSDNRPPVLSAGVEAAAQILGSLQEAQAMVEDRPAAIIAGKPVDIPAPRQSQKKRWWWFG